MITKVKKFLPVTFLLTVLVFLVQATLTADKSSASKEKKDVEYRNYINSKIKKLEIKTTDGLVLNQKSESRPVILNFWASWCTPCIKEFKSLNKLKSKYKDKILIIGINNDDEDPLITIKKIEDKYNLLFSSMSDPDSEIASLLNLKHVPSTIVLKNSKVEFIKEGEMSFQSPEFEKVLDKLL